MRFLIREQEHETLVAAGRFRYERDGRPTGVVEQWRLTAAPDDHRFLRVDLDAREAESGESTLYHLTLDPAGSPLRLSFRFFREAPEISGNVLFEDDEVTATRVIDGRRHEETMTAPAGGVFWFPAITGLSMLLSDPDRSGPMSTVTLHKEDDFTLRLAGVTLHPGPPETVNVMGKRVSTRPVAIDRADHTCTVWLDEHRWPLKMKRENLTAIETRYVRYLS